MSRIANKARGVARKVRSRLTRRPARPTPAADTQAQKLDEALAFIHRIKNGLTVPTGEHEALTSLFTGQKIYVDTRDTSVAPHLMLDGHWEPEITRVFRGQIKPDDTVFDIGANLGYFGIVAGTEVGPEGSIHFFEPNPALTKLIVKSASVNGLGPISSINTVAVGNQAGTLDIYFNEVMAGSGNLLHPAETGIRDTGVVDFGITTTASTPVITIDEYCAARNIQRVDVVKIDVEGFEPNVYAGMRKTIKHNPSMRILMEFTPREYADPQEFFETLQADFTYLYCIDNSADGRLIPLKNFRGAEKYLRGGWCMLLLTNTAAITKTAYDATQLIPTRLSTDLVNADFTTPWFRAWAERLDLQNSFYHCKFWEQAMLYGALRRYGMLQPGKRGLGFGVGTEQLVPVFASEGATIVATDQPAEGDALAWSNGQLASGKESLFDKSLVDRDTFERNVTFEPHDMNTFNRSYVNKFDFTWSNCVIGHLGSMKLSEKHLRRHAKYLHYGGVSVLTTELNISSLTETVTDNSGTIIWRLSDLYRLFNDMLEEDMVALPLHLRMALDESDHYIYYDVDQLDYESVLNGDYSGGTHVGKIPFSNYAIVQIQIIFEKKHLTPAKKLWYRQLYRRGYARNERTLEQFIHSHGDITDYATTYPTTDIAVEPEAATTTVTAKPGETKRITVTFTNNSDQPVFLYGLHTPLHVPPLVLGTIHPSNRTSKLHADSWFSSNRPSVTFAPAYDKGAFADRCHGYHRAQPGEKLTYSFDITAPKKKGSYQEDFGLILEGLGEVPKSSFTLQVTVR